MAKGRNTGEARPRDTTRVPPAFQRDDRARHHEHERAPPRGRSGNYYRGYQRNERRMMRYQYGITPYNGRRDGAPSTEEAPVVIPVVSHSGTGYRNTTNDLRFHGNSDHVEFLGRFNIEMDVYQVPDLARCRLLAATFREGAQQWFQKLGPGVITSCEHMRTFFLTQFQAAVKYTPPVTTLANVKQKEGESLTSYFKRFNAESTLVRGATNEMLKILLIARLRVGTDFWKHLQGKDPVSLADGRFKRRDRSLSPVYRRNARSPNRVNTVNTRREWSPPSNYKRRVSNFTPLAASIDHIFEVNKERGIFKKPDRLTSWQSRDKKKYYDYHESTGHDTHECRHLKDEIDELIKAAYLGEWIDKRVDSIRAIFGGHPFVGDSNRALKRNAREAQHPPLINIQSLEDRPPKIFKGESTDITFKEKELRWVHHLHNDALVITMLIGAMNVHRVFLDNGSSANI
ncbi:uncharacterized protein LOC141707007 [Apium graveolens]|uniref:uncharacterized protein LOC141707007 n=1 Tax=Apium graveolens TaxID=4045 RepID=UPI003D7B5B46